MSSFESLSEDIAIEKLYQELYQKNEYPKKGTNQRERRNLYFPGDTFSATWTLPGI